MKPHGYVEFRASKVKFDRRNGEPVQEPKDWPLSPPACSVCGWWQFHPLHGSRDSFYAASIVASSPS